MLVKPVGPISENSYGGRGCHSLVTIATKIRVVCDSHILTSDGAVLAREHHTLTSGMVLSLGLTI